MAEQLDNPLDGRGAARQAPSPFAQGADILADLAVIFTARKGSESTISASMAEHVETTLHQAAELMRLGERQRLALLQLLGRPVEGDGVAVVLMPFTVLDGGRA